MARFSEQLKKILDSVNEARTYSDLGAVLRRHEEFFRRYQHGEQLSTWLGFGEDASRENPVYSLNTRLKAGVVGFVEATMLFDETEPAPTITTSTQTATSAPSSNKSRVFLVHGHDVTAKETAARFLEKLGLETIILHEQANGGNTILEKFESHSKASFAVVLLTPDDIGGTAAPAGKQQSRARQNVIFELGYFVGQLTRKRVCILHKAGVELPSDLSGLVYIEMDAQGAWRTKVANELVQASIPIDLNALLKH